MASLRYVRRGSLGAVLGSVLGIVVAPLMTAAYHTTAGGATEAQAVWEPALTRLARPLLTFAAPNMVYATYGKLCLVVFLGILAGVLALRTYLSLRQGTQPSGKLHRWGFTLALGGLALNLFGNIGDYWIGEGTLFEGVAFLVGTILGLLLLAVGFAMVGTGALRTGGLPRIAAWLLILWLPISVALIFIGLNNLPSGPLLALSVVWVIVGLGLLASAGRDLQAAGA